MHVSRFGTRVRLLWLACLLAAPALADEPLTGESIAIAGNGSGAVPCVSCHGADGSGNGAAGFPRIAGQDARYIARQVKNIRDGRRSSAVMAAGLSTLTDEEADAVAAYYAALPIPDIGAEAPADPGRAPELATVGDWTGRNVPGCDRCHGPGARGVNDVFPGLAGQHASYLKTQLEAFRSGARATDPGDLMGSVARQLTDDEIASLSTWLAAQPATRPEVP